MNGAELNVLERPKGQATDQWELKFVRNTDVMSSAVRSTSWTAPRYPAEVGARRQQLGSNDLVGKHTSLPFAEVAYFPDHSRSKAEIGLGPQGSDF